MKNRTFLIIKRMLTVIVIVGYWHFMSRVADTFLSSYRYRAKYSFYEAIITYTDDPWTIVVTHVMGAVFAVVLLVLIFLAVRLLGWMFGIDLSDGSQEDDLLHCKDAHCRCSGHKDEYFNLAKGEWLHHECTDPYCRCGYHVEDTFDATKSVWTAS